MYSTKKDSESGSQCRLAECFGLQSVVLTNICGFTANISYFLMLRSRTEPKQVEYLCLTDIEFTTFTKQVVQVDVS